MCIIKFWKLKNFEKIFRLENCWKFCKIDEKSMKIENMQNFENTSEKLSWHTSVLRHTVWEPQLKLAIYSKISKNWTKKHGKLHEKRHSIKSHGPSIIFFTQQLMPDEILNRKWVKRLCRSIFWNELKVAFKVEKYSIKIHWNWSVMERVCLWILHE
jgi:hypothetical protein